MCNQLQNYENFAIAVLCRPVGCLTQPARLQCNGVQMLHDLRLMMNRLISGSAINDGASPKGATVPSPCGHIVSMWPHVVWMFPKDPPKRRGANDTQWAHHMKHFLSAQGCSWCSATLTAKPSAAQWDRQHQSAAKKNWVIECSSVLSILLCASVPALMYC